MVTAYYPETVDVAAVEADLQARLAELTDFMDLGEVKMGTTALAEEDWADNWKKYYEPARITHDLTIVPSWTDYEATAGEKIIKLDPGMAFGTGTHPTTKMSLFALEQVLRGGETVLDVGTGSGVLSIASSLLGAKEIFAYDLAPAGPKFGLMRGSISRQYIDWIKNDMEMLGICHSFLQLLQRF